MSTRLPVRAEVEEQFDHLREEKGTSSGSVIERLIGDKRLWWRCCQEAVREDPGWFHQEQAEQWRAWINGHAPDGGPAGPNPADPAYLVAKALSVTDQEAVHALRPLAEAWHDKELLPSEPAPRAFPSPDEAVPDAPERIRRRLAFLFERSGLYADPSASRDPSRAMVGLTALLLAGAERRKHPVVRVSVVFDRADYGDAGQEDGTVGVVELRELPAGPVGLFPDPQAMAGARSSGPAFPTSLAHAWAASPWQDKGRCVLWRIVLLDGRSSALRISGGSLGAAFALGLRELFRHPASRRLSMARLRGIVYGLRPKIAVTGCLDESARLTRVRGLGAKLNAVDRKRWRLVAPKENEQEISKPPSTVKFAESIRQADRYARQWRTAPLVTAGTVVALAAITGVIVSTVDATTANRTHTAARLAAVSGTLLKNDVGLAQLFAAEAYHYDATPQTRAALFQAVSASPHLVRSLQAGAPISVTAASGDGRLIAAGTKNGDIVTWRLSDDLKNGPRTPTLKLPGAVKMIQTDTDGGTGAAIDGSTVRIWPAGRNAGSLRVPAGEQPTAVAVSPSGRFVAVSTENDTSSPRLLLLELPTGRLTTTVLSDMEIAPSSIAIPDDDHLVLFDGAYGHWERLSTSTLARTSGSTVGFGTHDYGSALSANGEYFTYTNAGTWLPLWRTGGSPDYSEPHLTASTHGGISSALALSADGSRTAQAVDTTIYVSTSTSPPHKRPSPVSLTGAGTITSGSLAFLGGDRLVSASGNAVTLWDLDQISRLGTASDGLIPISCDACPGPWVGLQPNGHHVAVVSGNGDAVDVHELGVRPAHDQTERAPALSQLVYAPPLWTPDGTKLILISPQDDSAQIRTPGPGLPAVGQWPAAADPQHISDPPTLLQLTSDGRRVVEVTTSGTVEIRDMSTGEVLRTVPGPAGMAASDDGAVLVPQDYAAVDAAATHAAVINIATDEIHVTDMATGHSQLIHVSKPTGVAYFGNSLLIQRSNGTLEVWDAAGTSHIGSLQGATDSAIGPAVNGRNTIAEISADGTGRLIDYPSGYLLGTLPLPKGYKSTSIGMNFSPDGKELVTATEGTGSGSDIDTGEIVNWHIDDEVWLRTACDSAGHDITSDQWKQYMNTSAPKDLHCPQ